MKNWKTLNEARIFVDKGFALAKADKHEEAVNCFDKAIELDPNDAHAWYNKAEVYAIKGDKESAFKSLSKAVELNAMLKEFAKDKRKRIKKHYLLAENSNEVICIRQRRK